MKLKPLYYCLAMTVLPSMTAQAENKTADVLTVWGTPAGTNPDIITPKMMQQQNKKTAAEALNMVPGVILQKSGNRNEMQVKVRGFDSRQVPIFFDGIPTYVPYDGTLDLGRFMTSELGKIEVSKGYTSLLQGPNIMGGAINLTTRTPQKPFEANIQFGQGFARGKDNAYTASALLGTRSDLGFLQVSASQYKQRFMGLPHDADNNVEAGKDGKRYDSSSNDKRGMIKVGWTPREADEYSFTYLKQDGDKDSSPYAGKDKGPGFKYWTWPDYNKESFYFNGLTQISDGVTLQSRAYHDKFENTLWMYKNLKNRNKGLGDYSRYDDYSNGASLQLAFDMRENDLWSFSTHWKEDVHRENGSKYNDKGKVPSTSYSNSRYKDRTWSIASEYQWAATQDLDFVAGIGYDWRKGLQSDKTEWFQGKETNTSNDPNDQHAFNWQVLAKYQLVNDDNIQFSISDRTRFPTLKERYTTSKPKLGDGVRAIVNPHLEPERALTYDLTYQGIITSQWNYEASIYYNRISDMIMAHYLDKSTFQNVNSDRVDYYGLDLALNGQINDWLKTGINYSYIHNDVKDKDAGHITDLPKHKAYAWITVTPIEPLDITITEDMRAWSYNRDDEDTKIGGFAKTDIRVDYRIGAGFSVNASVNNVFDKYYEYTEGYMEEGRNFWLGAEYRY